MSVPDAAIPVFIVAVPGADPGFLAQSLGADQHAHTGGPQLVITFKY